MVFNPIEFVNNLKYMGLGMLGILIVMGLIVLVTVLLNKATAGKSGDNNSDDD